MTSWPKTIKADASYTGDQIGGHTEHLDHCRQAGLRCLKIVKYEPPAVTISVRLDAETEPALRRQLTARKESGLPDGAPDADHLPHAQQRRPSTRSRPLSV